MKDWDWVAFAALGVSVIALALSWLAYRQKVRYHPQPKLVFEWERELTGAPIPLYRVWIYNHGDASATDLKFFVESTARYPLASDDRIALAPGESWPCDVPLRAGAKWGEGAEGIMWSASEEPVRPRVRLTWRQAPFSGRPKSLTGQTPSSKDDDAVSSQP